MDTGSGINLIYAKTLRAMHISVEFLKPTNCSFHGIILEVQITHLVELHSMFASATVRILGEKN
jgi:hypothetical protein